jgi:hypothetical protein
MINKKDLQYGLVYTALLMFFLIVPIFLSRQIIYQADLGSIGLDTNGYARLNNVPMEIGESYTIWLSTKSKGGGDGAELSYSPNEGAKVDIFDSELQRIPNQITTDVTYNNSSESAYTIGVYTAQEKGPGTLLLKFREPLASSLTDYKLVIRKSGLSNSFLLMFSDGHCLWFLIVAGLSWAWQKIKSRGRVGPTDFESD